MAAAVGGAALGSVASSVIGANAAQASSAAQVSQDQAAAAQQQNQFNQTEADLLPYNQTGQNNLGIYGNFYQTSANQLGQAYNNAQNAIPQPMTESQLIQTPGYQFNLSQGLRATQNAAAAQGLGVSGAALQGAAQYATGLADSTYQNQFNNAQTLYGDYNNQASTKLNQLNAIYGQISAPVTTGEDAAAKTGSIGQQSSAAVGNDLTNAGNAASAGITGAANATSNATQSIGNSGLMYLGVQNALNQNQTTDTTSPMSTASY